MEGGGARGGATHLQLLFGTPTNLRTPTRTHICFNVTLTWTDSLVQEWIALVVERDRLLKERFAKVSHEMFHCTEICSIPIPIPSISIPIPSISIPIPSFSIPIPSISIPIPLPDGAHTSLVVAVFQIAVHHHHTTTHHHAHTVPHTTIHTSPHTSPPHTSPPHTHTTIYTTTHHTTTHTPWPALGSLSGRFV